MKPALWRSDSFGSILRDPKAVETWLEVNAEALRKTFWAEKTWIGAGINFGFKNPVQLSA